MRTLYLEKERFRHCGCQEWSGMWSVVSESSQYTEKNLPWNSWSHDSWKVRLIFACLGCLLSSFSSPCFLITFLRMLSIVPICVYFSGLQTGAFTRCPWLVWLLDHYTSFFGFCILLLSLSLHCKRCTKQMLDKDLEVIEWLTISGVKSNQLWQCPDFLCDTKSLRCKIPFSDPTLVLVASFGKSLIVAEALIGIWELGGRWVGAPYSSDFHKREKWMTPNLPKYFSRGIIENGGTGRLKANCWLFLFWRRFFLP